MNATFNNTGLKRNLRGIEWYAYCPHFTTRYGFPKSNSTVATHFSLQNSMGMTHQLYNNVQNKSFQYRTCYRHPCWCPTLEDERHAVRINMLSLVCHTPSYYYHPFSPTPILISYCIFIALWKPTKSWTPQIKQALGGEWSCHLWGRPQVGDDRKGYSPEDQHF